MQVNSRGEVEFRSGVVNIRGWKSSELNIKEVLKEFNLDVLGVVEHWCKGVEEPEMEGYEWYGINRVVSKRCKGSGGVGVLIKRSIWSKIITLDSDSDERMLWFRIRGCGEWVDMYVCIWYGECEGMHMDKVMPRMDSLEEKIKKFKKKGRVMVMGDCNAWTGKLLGENGGDKVGENGKLLVGVLERQGMIAANADKKCEGKWTRVMEVKNKNEVNVEKAVLDYIMLPSKDRNMISKVVVEESVDVESDHNLVWVELDIRYKEDILVKRKRDRNGK